MFEMKMNFNTPVPKMNKRIDRDHSIVTYNVKSSNVSVDVRQTEKSIRIGNLIMKPWRTNVDQDKDSNISTHTKIKNNDGTYPNSKPKANETLADIEKTLKSQLLPKDFSKVKRGEELMSDCDVSRKLPKVTSASAISPPHLSNNHSKFGASSNYYYMHESKSSSNCDTVTTCVPQSTSCYPNPIMSSSQTRHRGEVSSNNQKISVTFTPCHNSLISMNNDIQLRDKLAKFLCDKYQRSLVSNNYNETRKFFQSRSKMDVKLWSRHISNKYNLDVSKTFNHLYVNDCIVKIQLNMIFLHHYFCCPYIEIRLHVKNPDWIKNRRKVLAAKTYLRRKTIRVRNPCNDLQRNKKLECRLQSPLKQKPMDQCSDTTQIDMVAHESNVHAPSLTTKSFIGNMRVQSYFLSHPETQNVSDVVNALKKDTLYYNNFTSSNNVFNNQHTKEPRHRNFKDLNDHFKTENNVSHNCCVFYGNNCECLNCRGKKYSKGTKR